MGGEWKESKVGDFFDLVPGYAFKSKDFIDSGIPVIKIKNVKAGYFSEHQFSYVSEDFLTTRPEKIARHNDILISMSGNRHDGSPETWVGKVALFKKKGSYLINQRVGALRLKNPDAQDVNFVSYLLSSLKYQEYFISIATSSGGQANLSPKQILGTVIKLPPLPKQRAIAHILGTLDDKIELNRQMNRTLEAMAQALFKSWFIDFDPVVVNALRAGNPIPEKFAQRAAHYRDNPDALRLPEDTLRLFPDHFQDSELGPIPEGWEVRTLGGVADVNWGDTSVTKKSYVKDGYLAYSAKGPDGTLPYYDYDRIGVVVSAIGANAGKTWLAQGKWSCIKNTIRFWSTDSELPTTYLFLATNDVHSWPRRGSAQPFISQGDARNIKVIRPGNKLGVIFDSYISSAFEKTHNNLKESKRLSEVRDTLLPKLISGELRVPDAGAIIKDVTV